MRQQQRTCINIKKNRFGILKVRMSVNILIQVSYAFIHMYNEKKFYQIIQYVQ